MTSVANQAVVQPPPMVARTRIQSVDVLRGAIMMIMAIDHIRDFVNADAMAFSPTDLSRTTPAIFFTRWITHFCAPVFIFSAGMGAWLWMQRGRTKPQLSRFLITRGLWLIAVEMTVMHYLFFLDFVRTPVLLLILWAIGWSMIILAGLIYLPTRVLIVFGIAVVAGHNLLDPIQAKQFGAASWLWQILHQQGAFAVKGTIVLAGYPLIPWFAVMALGYCLARVFSWEPNRRRRFLVRLGIALTLSFVVVRAINVYGDPSRWSSQHSAAFTLLSFLNTTKYPPSFLFLLMTLGPALAALGWLDQVHLSERNPFLVFGRVPFLYYVVHFGTAHALMIAMNFFRYGRTNFLLLPPPTMGTPRNLFPANFGYPLWVVYAVWIAVLAIVDPLCLWFSRLKQRRKAWWLSYL
jgi:uncharacterized membrane protein